MKTNFVLFLFYLGLCFSLEGQQVVESTPLSHQHEIGLRAGYNQGYFKDSNFSPFNYHEAGILLGLDYEKRKAHGKSIFNIAVNFSPSTLKTDISPFFKSKITVANLSIDYTRKLKSPQNKIAFYVGGQYKTNFNLIDWNGLNAFSFLFNHGIGIKSFAEMQLSSRQKISSQIIIPIFSHSGRPPYNGHNKELSAIAEKPIKLLFWGDLTTVNKYQALEWKTTYQFQFSEKLTMALTYNLHYQRFADVHKLIQLQNQFTTGLIYKF